MYNTNHNYSWCVSILRIVLYNCNVSVLFHHRHPRFWNLHSTVSKFCCCYVKFICGLALLPLITRQTMNKPWYIDFARAKSEAPIYAFYFNFIQWSLNNCKVIHKFILNFRGQLYEWKTETWACDHLKANNWSAENLKTLDLGEFASEPAIQSCGSGQWIPCFDSCQLTVLWMSVIMLNTDYSLPH